MSEQRIIAMIRAILAAGVLAVACSGCQDTILLQSIKTIVAAEAPGQQLAAPTFAPGEGSYSQDTAVTITAATGTVIHYTDDGTNPTADSAVYQGPLTIAGNGTRTTLKALAASEGMVDSPIASASYAIDYTRVSTPQISPAAGTYNTDTDITISVATTGADIHYTQDGTAPTEASPLFPGHLLLSGPDTTMTIRTLAAKAGMTTSTESSATIRVLYPKLSLPTFQPPAGTYNDDITVAVSADGGAEVHYTTDGVTIPTPASPLLTTSLGVTNDGTVFTLKVMATKAQMRDSDVATATYRIVYHPITTVAGTGTAGYTGDDGHAVLAQLNSPRGVAVDTAGNLFIADTGNHCIRKVSPLGIITTVAGTGTAGYNGDGAAATSSQLAGPTAVAVDTSGNIFIADTNNNMVRKVDAVTGKISRVAGTGVAGFNGDSIDPTTAQLSGPCGLLVNGNVVFIADQNNHRVREVLTTATPTILTIAGTGSPGYNGEGTPSYNYQLNRPMGLGMNPAGEGYIADTLNERIRLVDMSAAISTVVGTGAQGYTGDNGTATSATLNGPTSIVSVGGTLYIADSHNSVIRKVQSGIITTIAGTGEPGYSGDGGMPTLARLDTPFSVAVGPTGSIYIADVNNNCIRKISY